MDFSVSSILAGILFGFYGFFVLKTARRDANITGVFLGAALLAYPYFVANPWACWGIGIVLSIWAYRALQD